LFLSDLDECTAGLKSCPETGSVCSDPDLSTNGTAICVCATGYTGNGTSCESELNDSNVTLTGAGGTSSPSPNKLSWYRTHIYPFVLGLGNWY
jgi:hypothetical protein